MIGRLWARSGGPRTRPGAQAQAREWIERRLDRLQRAFDTELQSNISLNLRGTALAIGSALAILLVAQFSATWLDDNSWEFPGHWDTVQRVLLVASLVASIVCLIVAVWWSGRGAGGEMMDRIDYLNKGSARKEAVALLRMLESQRALNERKGRRACAGTDPTRDRGRGGGRPGRVLRLEGEP